jgi:hypothetical protein
VSFRSKETLVKTCCERAKQLSFTEGPFGRTTQQIMTQITEGFAKVLWPVGEGFYDIERLGKSQDSRQPQQEFLPDSVASTQF